MSHPHIASVQFRHEPSLSKLLHFIQHIGEQRKMESWTYKWYSNEIQFHCESAEDAIFIAMNWVE